MKARKVLSASIACMLLVSAFSACTNSSSPSSSTPPASTTADSGSSSEVNSALAELGLDENFKFAETRKITVEIYDRANEGGSDPTNNHYTNFIKEGMLRDHNVEVSYVAVPRWTEDVDINNLLAAGNAPDICVTYSYPTIQTYAEMGGVVDLAPYMEKTKEVIPDLWDLLGETNIYFDQDPTTKTLWALEAMLRHNPRIVTFVREDWLKALNMNEPTTLAEFEAMLNAFKDNASTLLGADAKKMIPFSTSFDIGWRADLLNVSYVADGITDKELYINGYDDRHLLYPGWKEGVRKLNEWYNAGLVWKDFALYPAGDKTEDNLMKAGFVGSFIHNWDYPFRDGSDGIQMQLKSIVGEDAGYIAVDPFKNDAGVARKYLASTVDRKIFFPASNDEPVASLLYLNWISKQDNRIYLQFGDEGSTYQKTADGAYQTIKGEGDKIMNSGNNIDYTITINGIDLGDDELTMKSMALNYAGIDAKYVARAYEVAKNEGRVAATYNVGKVNAEEGMGTSLKEKRDTLLTKAVTASTDKFDSVYDSGMSDYMASGGQAIIDERTQKFAEFYE